MTLSLRQRLQNGELLLGTMVTMASTVSAEILADAGFDWLFLDAEHGALRGSALAAVLQVVGDRIPCLVRVPSASEPHIKEALDCGAAGIIVPQVNSADIAADCVRFARYAPDGERGVGLARAHGYGFRFVEYLSSANDSVLVVVQAEHRTAVANIESIAVTPGIDAVFLGPYDLSASLGRMGQLDHPVVTAAIDRVTDVCQAGGMPLGYFGISAEAVEPFIDRGYRLVVAGVDTLLLGEGARGLVKALHGAEPAE